VGSTSPLLWFGLTTGGILLVVIWVLLSLAFLLLADRKIWAGVQMRKGPERGRVLWPASVVRRLPEVRLKEIVIPAGADKVVFLLAPLISLILALRRLGRVPFAPGWVVEPQRRHPLPAGDELAGRLRHHHGRLGFELEVSVPGRAALGGPDGVVRSLDRPDHHHGDPAGRLDEPVDHRREAVGLVLELERLRRRPQEHRPAAGHDVSMGMFYISALAETNRPPFDLPEAESELVAGYQVEYSSTPYLLFMVGRVFEHRPDVRHDQRAVLRRLEPGFPGRPGGHGGWWGKFALALVFYAKICFWFFMIAMAKAIVPRYRYDQLMRLGWKVFLPTSLVLVAAVAAWRVFGPGA
jgi:NADH-quinone oxidoreductase subunit H